MAELNGPPSLTPAKPVREPVASLADLLAMETPASLQELRDELRERERLRLIREYEAAFFASRRRDAFLLSEVLAERGVPPCFRIERRYKADSLTPAQRFDLVAHDLQWLAATYPEHKGKGGHAEMLTGKGDRWLRVAEYYGSLKSQSGDVWMIVRQLQLDEEQQWECLALRSMKIKRAAAGLKRRQTTLKKALRARHLKKVTDWRGLAPNPVYARRELVWVCGEMTGGSPTKAARLYRMWTGNAITRQLANDDLQWLRLKVPEARQPRREPDDEEGGDV
ncbi:hypothetical protein AWB82_07069 [Caballeronia glebae]|uniref:Uncharacterized protein n=1 Tax=Caballeronia glebae TaxID=1777143 RepID=A0A158DQ64_9BURK|nr:hypothetical protein [Caballeronia glebae]SAK96769.1 hypothetical protein AWB82_07069 [Caballeronia glebae]